MNVELHHRRRWLAAVATLTALALFAWAWGSSPINLRDRIFPRHLREVEGGWLYRSGQIRPNLIESTLRDLDIRVIVDLTHEVQAGDASQIAERDTAQRLGIEIKRFPMNGSGIGSIDSYVGAIRAIADAGREGKHVLVHCRAGDRRTGGVIAAYQMLVKGEPVEVARAEMERFHRGSPRESKVAHFLDENLERIGEGLVSVGVIRQLPHPIPTLASR
jgi:protein tyrosine/serine phosphatase